MGWQWHQLDHMQIICTLLQTDNYASTSPLFLLPDPQSQSIKDKDDILLLLTHIRISSTYAHLILTDILDRCHTCDFVVRLWWATLTHDKVAACDFIVARCDFDAACDKQTFWEWTTIHSLFCFSALHRQSKDKTLCYEKPFHPKKDYL